MPTAALRTALDQALTGRFAHPDPKAVLAGLEVAQAGAVREGVPHTIHEILGHLIFWQDLSLRWLDGVEPPDVAPEDAWPLAPGPLSPAVWSDLVRHFARGLEAACRWAAEGDLDAPLPGVPGATALGCLQTLATHNSFHLGQIVVLRRLLGTWPPDAPERQTSAAP